MKQKRRLRSSKRKTARQRTRRRTTQGVARPRSAHNNRGKTTGSQFFDAPEVWHEPHGAGRTDYIEVAAGKGYLHPATLAEVRGRIAQLPRPFTQGIEVVQLSGMTRKRAIFPCYGMQWGPAVYLYPMEESLTEFFHRPPPPQFRIETEMYGGQWKRVRGAWILEWTRNSIRDYYLHNILIHEIGHLNDTRNRSYRSRERYANWFAIQYGYQPWRANGPG